MRKLERKTNAHFSAGNKLWRRARYSGKHRCIQPFQLSDQFQGHGVHSNNLRKNDSL